MAKAHVYVTYKESILDPQGEAVKTAVRKLGHGNITSIRIGKFFEIEAEGTAAEVKPQIEQISNELLANPNMETFRVEMVDG